uniref:Solute carrier family 22 member 18 n=1 Tax=Neogobius melanostomus TaxID=47308 RepID=A0A8C6V6W7_9GOBI
MERHKMDRNAVAEAELSPARKRTVIRATYAIAALDITWMFLQFSVTPYLAKKLGLDTLWFGYLQTLVGVLQLIGNPLFGRYGLVSLSSPQVRDLFGARAALSLSCGATVVFFLLLASAEHPAMLFITNCPPSQMVVTDLSEPEKRAESLSKIGLCFGVGMIVGSTLGGHLNTLYGSLTACVGAVGSLFSLMLVLKYIPKTTKSTAAKASTEGQKSTSFGEITRLLKYPGVAPTFIVKTVAGLPSGEYFQVMFSIIALEVFKLEPQQNGYLIAVFGSLICCYLQVIQGAVIGRLTARFKERSLLLPVHRAGAAAVGLGQAYMQTVVHFCLTAAPMMLSLNVFNVITDTILTKSVPSTDTGTMLGLCAAEQSLLRTLGPTLGGFLYVNGGIKAIGLTQCVVNAAVFIVLLLLPTSRSQAQESNQRPDKQH